MNNRTISIKKLLILLLYILVLALSFIFIKQINNNEYNNWIVKISYFIVFNMFVHLLILRGQSIKIFSMTGLLIILLYLFNFGQIVMAGLFPNYVYKNFNYIQHMDFGTLKETVFISILYLNIFFLGIIFTNTFMKGNINRSKSSNYILSTEYYQRQISYSKKIGGIILLFSLPCQLYIDINKLVLSFSGGYEAARSLSTSGIISAIGGFSYTAIALLIIGYSKSKLGKWIFYLATFWILISMLSGNRGHQMVALIATFYVANKVSVIRVEKKHIILGMLTVWLGTGFLNMIYDIRQFGISYFLNNLFQIIQQHFIKDSPFLETLGNFGETIYTLYLVLAQGITPEHGKTYLYSLVSILPNIGGIFTDINNEASFVKTLDTQSLGGSIIAELYFNFRYFGVIPAFILGGLLHKVSVKIDKSFTKSDYLSIAYLLPIFIESLWWVRDSFSNILRPIIWQTLLTFIVISFMRHKTRQPSMRFVEIKTTKNRVV